MTCPTHLFWTLEPSEQSNDTIISNHLKDAERVREMASACCWHRLECGLTGSGNLSWVSFCYLVSRLQSRGWRFGFQYCCLCLSIGVYNLSRAICSDFLHYWHSLKQCWPERSWHSYTVPSSWIPIQILRHSRADIYMGKPAFSLELQHRGTARLHDSLRWSEAIPGILCQWKYTSW